MDNNACRQLEIKDEYTANAHMGDLLTEVFEVQDTLQSAYGFEYNPDIRIGRLMTYLNVQHHALQDELREFFNAVGGVDTNGAAAWKNWKKEFMITQEKKLSDLSEGELLELQFEVIDMFKFWLNMAMAVGVDAQTFYNLFMSKTRENYDRIKRGY